MGTIQEYWVDFFLFTHIANVPFLLNFESLWEFLYLLLKNVDDFFAFLKLKGFIFEFFKKRVAFIVISVRQKRDLLTLADRIIRAIKAHTIDLYFKDIIFFLFSIIPPNQKDSILISHDLMKRPWRRNISTSFHKPPFLSIETVLKKVVETVLILVYSSKDEQTVIDHSRTLTISRRRNISDCIFLKPNITKNTIAIELIQGFLPIPTSKHIDLSLIYIRCVSKSTLRLFSVTDHLLALKSFEIYLH